MKRHAWTLGLGILGYGLLLSAAPVFVPPAHAQLFGESDDVKAARQAHEDDQDSQIGQLNTRVKALEEKIRGLTESLSQATGANEDLNHRLDVLNQKLDREQKDFAYRLCMISAQQLGAGGDDQGLNCAAAGTGSAPPPAAANQNFAPGSALPPLGSQGGNQQGGFQSGNQSSNQGSNFGSGQSTIDASGAPVRGRPPGNLGTLDSGPRMLMPPSSGSSQPQAQLQSQPQARGTSGGGTASFDTAMNLLAKAQYEEAKASFRGYADTNPEDDQLSPQAIYWVGDINYVQRNYPDAARAFAEQIKKYPKSSRSPDSMLKLGQSLLAVGQTSEGCTTLAALKSKYPNAPASTLAAAAGARKTGCPK